MALQHKMNRTDIINQLIRERGYKTYLEIGLENPDNNFNRIKVKAKDSVDPYVNNFYLSPTEAHQYSKAVTYRMTSDEFFAKVQKKYDIIFIDGNHTEEQCDRDIFNSMQHLNVGGCIVVHDCLPPTKEIQCDAPQPGKPWCGTVWKSVLKLIRQKYPVSVADYDYGVAIIEYCEPFEPDLSMVLDYDKDFCKLNMNLGFAINSYSDVVSYYTPLYKTPLEYVKRAYHCLQRQEDPRWEWVVLSDSSLATEVVTFIKCAENYDYRVKYYTVKPNSMKSVGEAKYRASMLCHGVLVAELDHDDLIMPSMTGTLKKAAIAHKDCGFFYTDSIELDNDFQAVQRYPEGFAMGYGSYRQERIINPVTGEEQVVDVINQPPINPGTIRHIVGVPNHVRCWRRRLLQVIGGYNRALPVADDYELIVRTFLATKMCYIPQALYLQIMHPESTVNEMRGEIQQYVRAIANTYHRAIAYRFREYYKKTDWLFNAQPNGTDTPWEFSPQGHESDVNEVYHESEQ